MAHKVEGWSDMRPGDRVYHYMVDGSSLCGKVGFHGMHPDTISPHSGGEKQPKDCAPCFKKMAKRLGLSSCQPPKPDEGKR